MTTIKIDIDDVPVRIGKKGFELTEDEDKSGGIFNFSVDVVIQADGHWDITEAYEVIGSELFNGKWVSIRGEKAEGQFGSGIAKFLEKFAEEQINDDVHDTIMQSDRKQFPKAVVV